MKEPITKFDLEAAFKALDEIESPKAGKVKANKPALTEIFSRKSKFDALMEEYYDINDMSDLDDAKEAREAEVAQAKLARIEKIVDLDAESPEDLLPSYVGKFIIQCPQCMTLFYKDPEDVEASEEDPNTVNVSEVCQHCGNEAGYTLIGKVGEATQEEMSDFNQEETVDVTSTDEGEAAEEPTDASVAEDEELDLGDLDLDELELDIEDNDEEEKTEESLSSNGGNEFLTEVLTMHESAGSDTKQIMSSIMNKLAEDDEKTWAKTTAEVIDVIPDNAIDSLLDELSKKFSDVKLTIENKKQLKNATNGELPVTEDTDTFGKLLNMVDSIELAKTSPKLMKTIATVTIAILGVLEPTPICEIIALIVAALPADIVAKVMAVLNPTGLVAAGVNKIHKNNLAKKALNTEDSISECASQLTEETELEISDDEFEQLISSPEFKKPISDTEVRTMVNISEDDPKNVSEQYDSYEYTSDDVMHYGKFLYAHWVTDAPTITRIDKTTYRVTRQDGRASVIVKIDTNNTDSSLIKFTVNDKPFSTRYTSVAQDFITRELDAAFVKQFDIPIYESITVNKEVLKYVVINPDGTYAGVPCTSEEEARELAAQKEGRIIVELGNLIKSLEEDALEDTKAHNDKMQKQDIEETTESLDIVMNSVDELQEASLEHFISDSLVETYGNVAGFRLYECAYENNKLSVNGTIYFTSGNTRKTTYCFTEAYKADGKINFTGLNEKLGLDKSFTLTGSTDSNKTFITESFKYIKK
jgi:hypothetical protein